MAPHFASELWSQFLAIPNRINVNSKEIKWDQDVLEQCWPLVDIDYKLDLIFKVFSLIQSEIYCFNGHTIFR